MYYKDYTKINKHLTFEDRVLISEFLSSKLSFKEIARRLCKYPTNHKDEIKVTVDLSSSYLSAIAAPPTIRMLCFPISIREEALTKCLQKY